MNPQEKSALARDVIVLIIEKLTITHVAADQVRSDIPLFSEENELDLDSVDAISIVVALQEVYGVRITDQQPAREILTSIDTIVEFLIQENATVRKS